MTWDKIWSPGTFRLTLQNWKMIKHQTNKIGLKKFFIMNPCRPAQKLNILKKQIFSVFKVFPYYLQRYTYGADY